MRIKRVAAAWGFALVALGIAAYFYAVGSKQESPRLAALQTLTRLDISLRSNSTADSILANIVLPTAQSDRTPSEQTEFVVKSLRDEVSADGLAILNKSGIFGTLTNVFPEEGERWARQAGVDPADCVAFRMESSGIRAEVVLATNTPFYKIVRCNNVKQLALQSSVQK